MAKKQTRRSISVSRTTYERLKAFCESNNISMSQLVETRVNDFLGPNDVAAGAPITVSGSAPAMPRPMQPMAPRAMPSGPSGMSGMSSANGLAPRPLESRPSHGSMSHGSMSHGSMSQATMSHGSMSHAPVSHAATAASSSAHAGHAAQHAGHSSAAAPASQAPASPAQGVPMTSVAARFAVEPPLPIIKPRQDTAAPKPAEKRPEQIFTF
jgi:hypothetical protein